MSPVILVGCYMTNMSGIEKMAFHRRSREVSGIPPAPRATKGTRSPDAAPALGWEIVEVALFTLALLVVGRLMVVNFRVDGESMMPSLRPGQYLLINRIAYLAIDRELGRWLPVHGGCDRERCALFQQPRRGEVVVFWPPANFDRPFVKRVIGLPGERVTVQAGRVMINGRLLQEDYIQSAPNYEVQTITVPEGHFFLLGDNRDNSADSHVFGMVAGDRIIGRAWLSYWPPPLIGLLPDQPPPLAGR